MKKTSLALAFAASLPMLAADAALACGSESYLGTICYTTYAWGCPQDTLPAAGQQMPISQYQALYSLLGIQFGGDARTYFNLPDLRGRVIVGTGTGSGLTPQAIGAKGGAETAALNANNLPAHTHPASTTGMAVTGSAAGSVSVPVTAIAKSVDVGNTLVARVITSETTSAPLQGPDSTHTMIGKSFGSQGAIYRPTGSPAMDTPVAAKADLPVSGTAAGNVSLPLTGTVTGSVAVGPNTTVGAPVAVRDPYLSLNACIVVNGLYPMRP